jgi:hypothetical protein
MARLFEFSDQAWLPRCFRRLLTELLQFQSSHYHIYRPAIAKLNELLGRSRCREILDLCSGSGGPLLDLHPYLRAERVTLSDRYPAAERSVPPVDSTLDAPEIEWLPQPLDARDVPIRWRACRTLFTSFHHFDRANARRILESAVAARAPIAVFEFTERTFARMWRLVCAPLLVWIDIWRMRPRNAVRLFWTYVLPVLPLLYTWDALVSHLRTYSTKEMRALTAGLCGHEWEVGTLRPHETRCPILYLIGLPAR